MKKYQLGDKWSKDFDYDGLIRACKDADVSWGADKLEKLYDSLVDVNYHDLARDVDKAVEHLRREDEGDMAVAIESLDKVRETIKKDYFEHESGYVNTEVDEEGKERVVLYDDKGEPKGSFASEKQALKYAKEIGLSPDVMAQGGSTKAEYVVTLSNPADSTPSGKKSFTLKASSPEEARKIATDIINKDFGYYVSIGYRDIRIKKKMAKGGALEKEFKFTKNFVIYVPSTSNVGDTISKSELEKRVKEVEKYVANEFGGYTETETEGGYKSTSGDIIEEDVVKVSVFAQNDDWQKNEEKVVAKVKEWANEWGQEAIGFEYEGDLYYIDDDGKFALGGVLLAGLAGYVGYKIGRSLPQKKGFETEKAIGKSFKKGMKRKKKMAKGGRIDLSEFETDNPKLFQCLLSVREFVANNSKVTDSYVDRHNGNYVVHFKDAHPYFEGLVKPTLTSMTYCEPYMHLDKVEVAKNHIKVPLKDFVQSYEEGGEIIGSIKKVRDASRMDGDIYTADYGQNGKITWEVPTYTKSYIIVQSMNSNWDDSPNIKKIKGEGAKAINDLFNKYPTITEILYDDESEGFWEAIGGGKDTLTRVNFYKYYNSMIYSKGGSTSYAGGGEVLMSKMHPARKNKVLRLVKDDLGGYEVDIYDDKTKSATHSTYFTDFMEAKRHYHSVFSVGQNYAGGGGVGLDKWKGCPDCYDRSGEKVKMKVINKVDLKKKYGDEYFGYDYELQCPKCKMRTFERKTYAGGGGIGVGAYILSLQEDAHNVAMENGFDSLQEYLDDLDSRGIGYAEYDEREDRIYTHSDDVVDELMNEGIAYKTYGMSKGGSTYAGGGEIYSGGVNILKNLIDRDLIKDKNGDHYYEAEDAIADNDEKASFYALKNLWDNSLIKDESGDHFEEVTEYVGKARRHSVSTYAEGGNTKKTTKFDRWKALKLLGYNYNWKSVSDKTLKNKLKELGYDPLNVTIEKLEKGGSTYEEGGKVESESWLSFLNW